VPTQGGREYSEETARIVDEEIKKLLADAHAKVRESLASHRQALEELAKLLLSKEVVERPELLAILKVRSIGSYKEKDKGQQGENAELAEERKT
jgi:cell division protease FtsH